MAELADAPDSGDVTPGKIFKRTGGKQTNRKDRLAIMMCGSCGITGGILMIVAAFMEDAFPRPLWFVAAICMFLNAFGILLNCRCIRKQEKANIAEERK